MKRSRLVLPFPFELDDKLEWVRLIGGGTSEVEALDDWPA